jgi:predicted Zn-dependent protease
MRALAVAAALGLALAGCKPKKTVSDAGDAVTRYAKSVGEGAGKLGVRAGQSVGLLEKKWDYVRLAYLSAEAPARLRAGYGLEDEREAGRALAVEFFGRYGRHQNAHLDQYLNLVLATLCAFSERPALPCSAAVLATEEVRTFALPGGYVLITLGSLRLAQSESEVAGALALALAHSQLRHPLALLERLQENAAPAEATQPVTRAAPEEFSRMVEEAARRLIQRGFASEEVRAASREATTMLVRLGYEPGGLKALLARTQVRIQERPEVLPAVDLSFFKTAEQAVQDRLTELHAPESGRSLGDRYRRECVAQLPAPR